MSINDQYKRYRQLLAIANQELTKIRAGWTDDDYRLALKHFGASEKQGRISATTMTLPEMKAALAHFSKLGFTPKKSGTKKPRPTFSKNNNRKTKDTRAPRIAKLNAMWIELHDLGAVNNRSQTAMESWCKKHVNGLSALRWATSPQLNQAVEMLKSFQQRVLQQRHGVANEADKH